MRRRSKHQTGLTSIQSKGKNVKGAAWHNNQIRNMAPCVVTPKEKVRRGSPRMMWWSVQSPLWSFCKG